MRKKLRTPQSGQEHSTPGAQLLASRIAALGLRQREGRVEMITAFSTPGVRGQGGGVVEIQM